MSAELMPSGTRGQSMPAGFLKGISLGPARLAYRLGLMKRMDGFPVIMLTTRGARSGQPRSAPVLAFPRGQDTWLVIGSAGGGARHPAVARNMAPPPRDGLLEGDRRPPRV